MTATILKNAIAATESLSPDGYYWLTISVPHGWDDVKKLTNKVLEFNGKTYLFRSWHSDKNEAYFMEGKDFARVAK